MSQAAHTDAPAVTIVIPVHNEARILESAVRELLDTLAERHPDRRVEVLLAENGSGDETPAIADRLAEADPRVRALHLAEPNYGAALRQGILSARGAFVVCEEIDLCDVDFHDVALSRLEAGEADLVVGSKAMPGAADHRPLLRRAATRTINGLLRLTLGFRGTDTHGLKALRRDALVGTVSRCVVDKDLFASEMVIRAEREGLRVVEVPVSIDEKRPPSIQLGRRVPRVLRDLARLIYVIRFQRR